MNQNDGDGTDSAGGGRRVVPVTFVDVWILAPVIATFGVVALTIIGAVPLVLLKIILLAMRSFVPELPGPILGFAALLIVFAALLIVFAALMGGLWLGCRLALRLFNAATLMALLYWKGFSWKEFRTAELRIQRRFTDRRQAG